MTENDSEQHVASSIVDYVAGWLDRTFPEA